MREINLVSSNQLIGELFSDFNIENDDWVNKAQRHIARGLGIMKIDGFYKISYAIEDVKGFNAPLPCDNKYILAVLTNVDGTISRLPLTSSLALGKDFSQIGYHTIYQGRINFNNLQTNFEEGQVLYIYYALPKDEEGNLLIPDNEDVLEALPYFIIYKLSLSGYKHPVIDPQTALQMWNKLYPIAKNSANYPSLEEMDRFTKMNTNPLFGDILNENWITGTEGFFDDLTTHA